MAPAIPDRWLDYSTCGKVVEGTNIICFKVPLRKSVQAGNKEIPEIWTIKDLLYKIPRLVGVIDLTNTKRYYDPSEFKAAGVLYKKIPLQGRVIPPRFLIREFYRTVKSFSEEAEDGLIGVHCTHGLNRTGYMVCSYMRDVLCINPQRALRNFERARGHKIERSIYVNGILRPGREK